MAEYIEREAVRDALYDADAITMKGIAIINSFPAADVVEVVRYQEAIRALNGALIVDNRRCFDGENFPCGYRQWCEMCDANEEYGCAHAYIEWLRGHEERRNEEV